MFITYGDTFLASPTSYDELYYELVRTSHVYNNLHTLGKQRISEHNLHSPSTPPANTVSARCLLLPSPTLPFVTTW